MELTVIDTRAISALPVSAQHLVNARFKKPIREYDGFELEKAIKNMLLVAFVELGQTTSAQDEKLIVFLRDTLCKDLKKPKFSGLSLEAVHLFISNGIRGEYGTFNGQMNSINIQNIHHWIRMGTESHEWKDSLEQFNRVYLEQNTSKVPLQVKIRNSKEGIISAFDHYQKGEERGDEIIHRLPFCGFAYYDILNEMIGVEYSANGKTFKTLVTDPAARKLIVDGTVKAFKKDLAQKKSKAEYMGKKDLVDGITEMLGNLSENKTLENKVKEKMLGWYFDQLIKEGRHISEILENHDNTSSGK